MSTFKPIYVYIENKEVCILISNLLRMNFFKIIFLKSSSKFPRRNRKRNIVWENERREL